MVKINRIFLITFIVSTIFLLHACSKKKPTPPPPSLPQWTILGYFDGNNPQDLDSNSHSYVIKDVQGMEQVGSTKDIQIMVTLGSFKTGGNCKYYLIEKFLNDSLDLISSKVLDSLEQKDMSDRQTLRDFIKYGVDHYPAQHYMLIINDHGDGWKGVCYDTINDDGEMMTLPEFSSALSGYKFEIIVFNAPSMSMLEVAYQLKDNAHYLVASQYHDHAFRRNILGFTIWLQGLVNSPNISVRSLARNIAVAIHTSAEHKEVNICTTDLSKVNALTSKVADFESLLVTHTGAYWKEVLDARESPQFSQLSFHYYDLKTFTRNIQNAPDLDSSIKNAAKAVEDANGIAVIETQIEPPNLGYGGLCIHFPLDPENFDSTDYVQLDFTASNWHIFLSRFTQAYLELNTGSLRVVSIPEKGARISLDGEDTGFETDTTIHGIPPGSHLVKVNKLGWHMLNNEPQEVFVNAGVTTEIIIPLLQGAPPRESLSELQ